MQRSSRHGPQDQCARPGPLSIPRSLKQHYLNVLTELHKVLKAKDCTTNHSTNKLVGVDDRVFTAIFNAFTPLPLHCWGKDRINRKTVSSREEPATPVALKATGLGEGKRLVRELDGTTSETAFETLQNWCAFGRRELAGGSGRNFSFGWGNCKWARDGTLIIVVRVQVLTYVLQLIVRWHCFIICVSM